MGSKLSGRLNGKPLVEDCQTLDLAWLMRLGPIRNGQAANGEIHWHVLGDRIGWTRFRLELQNRDDARLSVASETLTQTIALVALKQHFGGQRWWMRCPITGERARTLHLPPGGDCFASRKALGLAYRVERFDRFDRPFEKFFRAQRRLGGVQGLAFGLERPKGMWRRTFARHAERFERLEVGCMRSIVTLIENA